MIEDSYRESVEKMIVFILKNTVPPVRLIENPSSISKVI